MQLAGLPQCTGKSSFLHRLPYFFDLHSYCIYCCLWLYIFSILLTGNPGHLPLLLSASLSCVFTAPICWGRWQLVLSLVLLVISSCLKEVKRKTSLLPPGLSLLWKEVKLKEDSKQFAFCYKLWLHKYNHAIPWDDLCNDLAAQTNRVATDYLSI